MTILNSTCLPSELVKPANKTAIASALSDCSGTPHVAGAQIPTCADVTARLTTKADLVGGTVPASQLPAYVDDVLEFATLAAFPATGATGVLYADAATGKIYRWTGTVYAELSASSMISVSDEGTLLTSTATSINFTGAGVTASSSGGAVTVVVPKPVSWVWDAALDGSATLTFSDGTTLAVPAMPFTC
jgi:hypothetical protein